MAIPRKKVLQKIAGFRKAILEHLDEHFPSLIERADRGLVEYWRKEMASRIGELEHWAHRLSKNEKILDEVEQYRQRLSDMLNNRVAQLDV